MNETVEDRSLEGWCNIILGVPINCTECDYKGHHKKYEGPLQNCPKCYSKLEYSK